MLLYLSHQLSPLVFYYQHLLMFTLFLLSLILLFQFEKNKPTFRLPLHSKALDYNDPKLAEINQEKQRNSLFWQRQSNQ